MKKSLLALAVLGAFAGVASAQSSVTLFGTIDLNARYVKNDGSDRRVSLSQDGINSSQLGFRGVEDLGGGLKASFILLQGVSADTGTQNGAKLFNRRSTVSLMGGFGEVRLGRDYTPSFWNNTIFDAFGTNGLGDSSHVAPPALIQSTFVRADNSIGYFLPANIGGLYGQFMVAAPEGVATGKYIGGRLGFAAGPFDIAGSYAETGLVGTTSKAKDANIGGSWNFGFMKLMGYYAETRALGNDATRWSTSVVVPMGQGEIHAGYSHGELNDLADSSSQQIAIGYVYNVSKRTALYSTYSQIANKGVARQSVSGGSPTAPGGSQVAVPTAGGDSKGFEVGVRHFF